MKSETTEQIEERLNKFIVGLIKGDKENIGARANGQLSKEIEPKDRCLHMPELLCVCKEGDQICPQLNDALGG